MGERSRKEMVEYLDVLAEEGFTGRLTLEYVEGGIRAVEEHRRFTPDRLRKVARAAIKR